MKDQASALRQLQAEAPRAPAARATVPAFVLGSGKGGVGKSVLSVLLAGSLARMGKRVLLFDGSQNQGNLHILLGVRPAGRLDALLAGKSEPSEMVTPVTERIALVPGACGAEAVYALAPVDRARLHHRLSSLYEAFDVVIVDSGPGIDSVVRATIRATRLVVVTVPEPAALSDAYALVKITHLQVPSLPAGVLVNRVAHDQEASAAFDRLALASRKFLTKELSFLGAFPDDDAIQRAVRSPGRLLAHVSPEADAAIERLVKPSHASDLGAMVGTRADR